MKLDTKKVKNGTIVTVEKVKDNSKMVFQFYKVGYKHTNFTMVSSTPKHPAEGCGYYSLKSDLNNWFKGSIFDSWEIVKILY